MNIAQTTPEPRRRRKSIWNQASVPHKGWTHGGVCDVREDKSHDPNDVVICEMCGQTGLRFVHQMTHPNYAGFLSVGSTCASKMATEYVAERETKSA